MYEQKKGVSNNFTPKFGGLAEMCQLAPRRAWQFISAFAI